MHGCSLCIEIDECADGIDGCAQVCTNSPGSYTCSCNSGFVLSVDNHRCNGEFLWNQCFHIFICFIHYIKILMNAKKILMAAVKFAQILLDLTDVVATLATGLPQMDTLAMVSKEHVI
jgi:hypothetical protein